MPQIILLFLYFNQKKNILHELQQQQNFVTVLIFSYLALTWLGCCKGVERCAAFYEIVSESGQFICLVSSAVCLNEKSQLSMIGAVCNLFFPSSRLTQKHCTEETCGYELLSTVHFLYIASEIVASLVVVEPLSKLFRKLEKIF